jgi:hypothetical protein
MRQIDDELLPCPFCGSQSRIFGEYQMYYVACTNADSCGCSIGERYDRDACPDHKFCTELDALEAWNRRVKI